MKYAPLKITVPEPDFIGDWTFDPVITERQPRYVRMADILYRWGMGPKTFKTLLGHGILKPHITAPGVQLFDLRDVVFLEREGWPQREGLQPGEAYPIRGDMPRDE